MTTFQLTPLGPSTHVGEHYETTKSKGQWLLLLFIENS